ncbi:MAG: hypothetical protein RJB66_1876 [Pseudomonadota bacterium]|jgi:hypothetical protein
MFTLDDGRLIGFFVLAAVMFFTIRVIASI